MVLVKIVVRVMLLKGNNVTYRTLLATMSKTSLASRLVVLVQDTETSGGLEELEGFESHSHSPSNLS